MSRTAALATAAAAIVVYFGASARGAASSSLAASGAGEAGGPLLVVGWPRAELSRWLDADGVPARRFVDLCRREGWILRPGDLAEAEAAGLDRVRLRAGDDLLWRGTEGAAGGLMVLGRGDGTVRLRWEGALPPGDPARLESESRAWLPSSRRMRWEEVVEVLDLTAGENRAFQAQGEEGAFASLRVAFLRDKTAANLSIYLAGTRRPRALAWRLALTEAFEGELVPLATLDRPAADPKTTDAARRRLFARRLLASRSRAYGRCDRILLSLAAEAPRGALLVVDARDSRDPFVAVARVGEALGAAARRGDLLARRLAGAVPP